MLSYESIKKYNGYVNDFESSMERIFGSDVKKIRTTCCFEVMGNFSIEYVYYPHNYKIVIENSMAQYSIEIYDKKGGVNYLSNIVEDSQILNKENIENSISLLHDVLEENDFDFIVTIGRTQYRRTKKGLIKVKEG